jgi:hypothetical protein
MARNSPQSRPDVPWSKRREIPDSLILDAADQYEAACRLLFRPPGSGVSLPFMNTAAISIELYLKSLSAVRIYTADSDMPDMSTISAWPEKTGHFLESLFDVIANDTRVKLTAAFDRELRPKFNMDFVAALKTIEGAFAISRYPFEPEADIRKYKPSDLADIANFLRSFVKSLPVVRSIE